MKNKTKVIPLTIKVGSIRRLDLDSGTAFGTTQHDSIVPMAILGTHELLENV